MDKYIGKKLDGRYEITELIGLGGMADVYKATDIIDNKTVAVKILKREYSENEEFLRRFRNESKMIATLSHPNVVKVYDVGFSDKLQFIVMEYIDGMTLKDYMEAASILPWKESVHFIIQVLRALQHAHDRGIIHRDIKPQNIMLLSDGTVKVMDFGIAKSAREQSFTATDQALGTVYYISPEQARGDETDEKSDIYSVGVMLYEMLTGKKPFDADKPVTIAVMHINDIPKRPKAINPDIPAGLEEIILRAMEKDPENRYQTAADMIRDIESFKSSPNMTFGYYKEDNAAVSINKNSYDDEPDEYEEYEETEEYEEEIDEPDEEIEDEEIEDGEGEEEEPRSLFIPVMTAVTIAFIVVAVFFILWLVKGVIDGGPDGTTRYEMPNLVGLDYYEAKDTYTYLDIQINETESSTYEKDVIYFQDVAVGDAVSAGQTVYVNVSLGVSMVQVPDVKNYHYEYAKKILEQEDFVIEQKYEMSSEGVEASKVIRTEPAAGEMAESGSTVIVYISRGITDETIQVMNMVGDTLEHAQDLCKYYGLVATLQESPSTEPANTVIAQSIEAGQLVQPGTEIILTYSNGQDPSHVVPFSMTLPSNATGRFVLDFLDSNGTTVASSSTINAAFSGNTINVPVEGAGTQQLVVILSNYNTNQQAELGVYNFDFANITYSAVRENIQGAFEAVGGIYHPTEAPTEAPTVIATDPIIYTVAPNEDQPEPVQQPEPEIVDPTEWTPETTPPLTEDVTTIDTDEPTSSGDDVASAPETAPEF